MFSYFLKLKLLNTLNTEFPLGGLTLEPQIHSGTRVFNVSSPDRKTQRFYNKCLSKELKSALDIS